MRPQLIFLPVSVLALWTGAVVALTGVRRIRAVRQGRVPPHAFQLGDAPGVPEQVVLANRNLMNLLEMPLLFYVVSLSFFVTGHVTARVVELAWVYVALRIAHSLIHVTTNRVLHRLLFFAFSNFVLVSLWIAFLRAVL